MHKGVVGAGYVAVQRIRPHRHIISISLEAEERIVAFRRCLVGISPLRQEINRVDRGQERSECECANKTDGSDDFI